MEARRKTLPAGIVARSRALRRNATAPELKLWRALREAFPSARFRFQVPFGPKPYHADFCSHRAKLIVEVDGDTHADSEEYDARRTDFLDGEGYEVVRFGNADVMGNVAGVVDVIAQRLSGSAR